MRVLGISGAFGHDAATALVVDGRVVAACEEERFVRVKRAIRHPAQHSVQACLDVGGLELEDIDCIAVGWDPLLAPDDSRLTDSLDTFLATHRIANARRRPPIRHVPHHVAHAALAYRSSGFSETAVLVADGQGEASSASIYVGREGVLTERLALPIRDSLGFFFAAVTRYIGFAPGSAGKVMGLAALGEPTYEFPELELQTDSLEVQVAGRTKSERMEAWIRILERRFGPRGTGRFRIDPASSLLSREVVLPPHLRDAAASAQLVLERAMLHLSGVALKITGCHNLALGGGVALNCASNGRIRAAFPNVGLWVHGAAHDGGTALGAALAVAADQQGRADDAPNERFLGPEFDSGCAVDLARRAGLRVQNEANPISAVAERIAAGEIGGWHYGRAEYGPRALGARSILARADDASVARRVNVIKRREPWRPLAPAVCASLVDDLALGRDGLAWMVEARWLSDRPADVSIGGVIHTDGSIRPLEVSAEGEPLSDLMTSLRQATGLRALVNTSLNLEHEPITLSPVDALRTFAASELDFLVLDGTLVTRP